MLLSVRSNCYRCSGSSNYKSCEVENRNKSNYTILQRKVQVPH